MADNQDEDQEFSSEQVKQIAQTAVEQVIGSDNIVYQKEKVNQWCQQIIENCIKELARLAKPFKYAVTCIIT